MYYQFHIVLMQAVLGQQVALDLSRDLSHLLAIGDVLAGLYVSGVCVALTTVALRVPVLCLTCVLF